MEGDVLGGPEASGRFRVRLTIFGRPVDVELECPQVCGPLPDEEAWLACCCVRRLQAFLGSSDRPLSARKWRLFGCACTRRLWHLLPNDRWRAAVETSERYADGATSGRQLRLAVRGLGRALTARIQAEGPPPRSGVLAAMSLAQASARPGNDVWPVLEALDQAQTAASPRWQACLLRDLAGNPFRPAALDPAWLAWSRGLVLQLAWAVYEEQRWQDLPVLADAWRMRAAPRMLYSAIAAAPARTPAAAGWWIASLAESDWR
jgi:hypothetical protein